MNYVTAKRMQGMLDKERMTVAGATGDERFSKILREREQEKTANMDVFKMASDPVLAPRISSSPTQLRPSRPITTHPISVGLNPTPTLGSSA